MVYADLHVHTDNSDGQIALESLPRAARKAEVSVVAVTDHDRFHPGLASPIVDRDGITIVHGIELRVEAPSQRVDLLGYGLEKTPDLEEETDRLAADRKRRGHKILDCLEDELGIDLALTIDERTGRPHLARAVVSHPETDYSTPREVFLELIGTDRPCYVPRRVPSFERGVSLLKEATRIVGLAHPFRYENPQAALDLCVDLDAVERFYPYDRSLTGSADVDRELLDSTIENHDLLRTGGSDSHGLQIGTLGLNREDYLLVESVLSPEP